MSLRREVGYRYDDLLALMDEGEWYTASQIAALRGQHVTYVRVRLVTACEDSALARRTVKTLRSLCNHYQKRRNGL